MHENGRTPNPNLKFQIHESCAQSNTICCNPCIKWDLDIDLTIFEEFGKKSEEHVNLNGTKTENKKAIWISTKIP